MKIVKSLWLLAVLTAPALAQEPALLVVEKKANAVGFYTSAGERVSGAKVGLTPHEVVLDPTRAEAYVSDNGVLWMDYEGPGGNTISIVDFEKRERVGVIPTGKFHRPHGLSIDPRTRRLIITSENPDRLVLIDVDSRAVIEDYDNGGKAPHMVMFDAAGVWAFASNTNSDTIGVVRVGGGETKTISGCDRPQGGVLNEDGSRYYVTCSDGAIIQVIDTVAHKAIGEIKTSKGVNRVAITPDQKTLVYSIGGDDKRIGFADVATLKETKTVDLGGSPLSLTLSKNGKYAFSGVQDNDEIYVLSVAERKVIQVIKTPQGAGPDPIVEIGEYVPPK